jgi:hypothetical protein
LVLGLTRYNARYVCRGWKKWVRRRTGRVHPHPRPTVRVRTSDVSLQKQAQPGPLQHFLHHTLLSEGIPCLNILASACVGSPELVFVPCSQERVRETRRKEENRLYLKRLLMPYFIPKLKRELYMDPSSSSLESKISAVSVSSGDECHFARPHPPSLLPSIS